MVSSIENLDAPRPNKASPEQRESRRRRRASKAVRMQSVYEQRLAELQQSGNPVFKEAERVTELVEEPNTLSIYRMVELFGPELVAGKAAEAWTLFQEAKNRGKEAYVKSAEGTAVATKKGQPRTPGGVFFYLMRQYSDSLGLRWAGLHLPELPNNKTAHLRPNFKMPDSVPETTITEPSVKEAEPKKTASTNGLLGVAKVESTATPLPATPPPPKPSNVIKPTRSTIKIIGSVVRKPKYEPNGKAGIVELEFNVEMSQSLPKGLPNLGKTRAVVWCSQKQYEKIKNTVTPQTRFLIEGEPSAAIRAADETAFIKVICLKLSTLEIEQAMRANREESN